MLDNLFEKFPFKMSFFRPTNRSKVGSVRNSAQNSKEDKTIQNPAATSPTVSPQNH